MQCAGGPSGASTTPFRVAEKWYKRDGKNPNDGLSNEQLRDLLDFDECALSIHRAQ